MPGTVSVAAPATVMPWNLCKAFRHDREYPTLQNDYRNGESQRSLLADSSRKRWTISQRLIPADLDTLRDFYDARAGGHQPFYFYDVWETSPKFSYDPTGVQTSGRYIVRFDNGWSQVAGIGRLDVPLSLVEVV